MEYRMTLIFKTVCASVYRQEIHFRLITSESQFIPSVTPEPEMAFDY